MSASPSSGPGRSATPVSAAERPLVAVEAVLANMTSAATLAVMVIVVADVVGRYAFNQPIGWVYDLVSIYYINLVLYFMASETLRVRGHIALDLRLRFLPRPLWRGLQAIAWIAVAAAIAVSAWRVSADAVGSFTAGDVHPGLYEWPVWVEKAIVGLGLILLVCRIVLRIFLLGLGKGEGPREGQGAARQDDDIDSWELRL
ncbi:TRAP transporter small permease [Marinibaculum pumilum]|uniref:TRAP transporter small permease protein n=1 Tax=Marinibaculum pumilum TaxID=1766165 RepID=A0ABV7KZM1_9PROT